MPTKSGSVKEEGRCTLPVSYLVLDATGSSYLLPAVLSYMSSDVEKNDGKACDGDMYLYIAIIPGTYGTAMSYALWYKKLNGDCSN